MMRSIHRTPSRSLSLLYLASLAAKFCVATPQVQPPSTNASANINELLLSQNDDTISDSYHEGSLRGSLVLFNGRIHTMDSNNAIAKALAVQDGQIVYVGDSKDEALRKGQAGLTTTPLRTIDLQGRMAIPGLIDCHNHIVLLGNRPGYHTPLERAYSVADVQATYKARAAEVPKGEFITTIGGFHPNQFSELRLPTLAELDAASPDHPVFISIGFSGPAVTNSLGKAIFSSLPGNNTAVSVSTDGSIASGLENGKALLALRQNTTFSDRQRSTRDAMAYAASVGVTTHLDQGAFPATGTPSDGAANEDLYSFHKPFLAVYAANEGIIRLRINFLHMDDTTDTPSVTQRLLNTFPFFGNSMVRTGAIGEFVVDFADYAGGPLFEAAAKRIAQAGWRLEVHSLSATDFAGQISAFEAVDKEVGIRDLRWVVAHVPLITKDYLARLKALGGGVNLSGWQYLAGTPPPPPPPPTGNGTSRGAGPPWRDIIDSKIPAGFGADGANIAPLSPWPHVYYAITGKNAKGEVINDPARQGLTREEALRLYTSANSWFLGGPDETALGTLEVGKLGDVVVLSDDYFKVTDEDLKTLRSVLTVVGGVVVHDSGDL